MLVYQKVIKKPIRLEFSNKEEENVVMEKFGLGDSIYVPPKKMSQQDDLNNFDVS